MWPCVGGGVGENFTPTKAENHTPIRKVAITGHSYVTRLNITAPLYDPCFQIRKFPAPGATVTSFPQSQAWSDLVEYRPDYTCLILGGNDIRGDTVVRDLVEALADLVLKIESQTGGWCFIVGIEARDKPRDVSPDQYRRVKNAVNKVLKRIPRIRGRYVPMNMDPINSSDGVHLNPHGSELLFNHLLHVVRECLKHKDFLEGKSEQN